MEVRSKVTMRMESTLEPSIPTPVNGSKILYLGGTFRFEFAMNTPYGGGNDSGFVEPESIDRLIVEAKRHEDKGEFGKAEELLRKALSQAVLPQMTGEVETLLAENAWAQERDDEALQGLRRARDTFRQLGDTDKEVYCIRLIGDILFSQENFELALDAYRLVNDQVKSARALWGLGRADDALDLMFAVREGLRATEQELIAAGIDLEIGGMLDETGRSTEAVEWFGRAVETYEQRDQSFWEAIARESLADALDNSGRPQEAQIERNHAISLRNEEEESDDGSAKP
jgi:tetratricopeptide (TPR) repeat protein